MGGGMGGGGMGGGGMGGGGTTIVDPPVGAAFRDPVEAQNVSTTPGQVMINLEAKLSPISINGTTASLMTYNGYYPAPTIRIRRGNELKINLKNSLPATTSVNMLGYQKNITNLHTHGLHVSPEEPGDYVMYELAPGESYNHRYDTSLHPSGTLSFYHPHIHGLSAEQYWSGLAGALVTEDETTALAPYETHIMVLKDITITNGAPEPHSMMMDYMHGKEGNVVMINGQVNPALAARPGQVQRWRFVNASNARHYRLSLQGHKMYLAGTDGGLLDKPYQISEILLSPGERADILVKASATKANYKLYAMPYARNGMMTSAQTTLLTMKVGGTSLNQALPTGINPMAMRMTMDTSMLPKRTLSLSMGQGRGFINGMDFDVAPFTIMSELGSYEVWTIVNNSGMDHPFHQHVNPAQVLSMTGAPASYPNYAAMPAWKDTVLIPKGGSATILIPVMDFPGMAMFHCHILEHEDIGMMGMWHIMDGGMSM